MNKKKLRNLGKQLKRVKTWEKGTHIAGKALNTAGDVTMLAGTVTGQPEVVGAGASMKTGGATLNKTSKILKKIN